MTDTKDSSAPAVEKTVSVDHEEHTTKTVETPELATVDVTYDSSGIKGLLHSPFVCGAALLASFGGFSFGYGKSGLARHCFVYYAANAA